MNHNRLSLAEAFKLRNRAFAEIRRHSAAIDAIAVALAELDAALQLVIAEQNIDDQQALVTTARRLAALLDRGQA